MAPPLIVAGAAAAAAAVVPTLIAKIGSAIEGVRKLAPVLMDEVTVRVDGQPGASKQELYYLALAAANGVVRRFQPLAPDSAATLLLSGVNPPAAASIRIEYDAADHWVMATISYRVSTVGANIQTGSDTVFDAPTFVNQLAVYRGPQCEVVGGEFDFIYSFSNPVPGARNGLPGVPGGLGQLPPKLPFAGQVILTGCPETKEPQPTAVKEKTPPTPVVKSTTPITSPNPKPPGDNRSRGVVVTKNVSTSSGPSPSGSSVIPATAGAVGASGSTSTAPPSSVSTCCPKTMKLVQLVFAALTDPGSANNETWEPPVQGPQGG